MDANGRPTLADWAGVTNLVESVSAQNKAQQSEQRDIDTARLSDALATQPEGSMDLTGADPRVAYRAKVNALAQRANKLRFTNEAMATRVKQYEQNLYDIADFAKKGDAAHMAGDHELGDLYYDHAYGLVPDGNHLVGREGDIVTLESPTGKQMKMRDDLSWQQKSAMLQKIAQSPQDYIRQAEAQDQTRFEHNANAELHPEFVGIDQKTGQEIYKYSSIDPKTNRASVTYRDSTGNVLAAEGSGRDGILSYQKLKMQEAQQSLENQNLQGQRLKKEINTPRKNVIGSTLGQKLLIQNDDGSVSSIDNPAYTAKPEMKPSEAIKRITAVREKRAKLEAGDVAGMGNIPGLDDQAQQLLNNVLAGKTQTIPPELKQALNDALSVEEQYYYQFVPDPARYDKLDQDIQKLKESRAGTQETPSAAAKKTDNTKSSSKKNTQADKLAPAAPPAEPVEQAPDPAKNVGKILTDNITGIKYKSDGKQWVPIQ